MVHEITREKATKKLGFWGRFLPLAVSSIAGAIVSIYSINWYLGWRKNYGKRSPVFKNKIK